MPPPLRKKGPKVVDPEVERSRKRGALLGLAVGDALGSTNEFRKLTAPPFPQLCDGPHTEMRGGGPFQLKPGQVTDDTHMACCLANVLRVSGSYDAGEAAKAYLAWKGVSFDVGNSTREVLEAIQAGTPRELAAQRAWTRSGRRTAGNGSLMRTAPIGVFFASDSQRRLAASLEDSALTHYDPKCQLACAALNASIAAAVTSLDGPKPDALVDAANAEISRAAAELGRAMSDFVVEVRSGADELRADLSAARQSDPMLYGPELHLLLQEGFVRVSFRLAYWELLHAKSFEAALLDVVNRGGDSDTNGAITGSLLGAVYGEEAIPARWREPVLNALQNERPGPLRDVYHPLALLELVP